MTKLLFVPITLLLAGCDPPMPGPVINEKLDNLTGQPVSAVSGKLGYPASEEKIAGKKVYVWLTSNESFWECTERLQCTLKIFVDNSDKIVGHDFQGNYGACERFAAQLDPSYH